MTLNPVGETACMQCGVDLALEPEAEATRLLCPRGCGGLVAISDVCECERCGGIFVENTALAGLVERHRPKEEPDALRDPRRGDRRASITPPVIALEPVVYLPCPTCNVRMNRTVFGKSSGVIVDVCKVHGTWFDARELTASLAFVERGGLALVERRERERKAEEARAAEVARRTHGFDMLNRPMPPRMFDDQRYERGEAMRNLLDVLLSL